MPMIPRGLRLVRRRLLQAVPVLVFVGTSRLLGLPAAAGAALGVATLILLWRLVRRESVQPAPLHVNPGHRLPRDVSGRPDSL